MKKIITYSLPVLMFVFLQTAPAHAQGTRSVVITKDKDSITATESVGVRVVVTDASTGTPLVGVATTVVAYDAATNTIASETAPQDTQANGAINVQLAAPSTPVTYAIGVRFGTPAIVNNSGGTIYFNVVAGTSTSGSSGTTSTTPAKASVVTIPNPITCADATCLVSQVIRYVLGIIAIIATLMFVWGGVMMLTSGGNADQVRKAKETLVWAAIGVIVILLSWVIIKFVLQGIAGTGQ